ncbi:hypothetical protein [Streptacidiphilus neutrinimicus]|uniref:hypothetical protein n=1 Tax=Streptacidiphilus neutrinimicus TaxID=105420 RepID=UPI0005A8AC07|nr:hypothetical protein [Streptacidiphilus neutrinimicus]
MTFTFHLTRPTQTRLDADYLEDQGPLEDPSDYDYLAMRACTDLAQTDTAFHIGGFGTQDWGFDISYDMSSFVESLPELVEALHGRKEFELDLYPQGVERTLTFRFPSPDTVEIDCASRTSWVPNPPTETTSRTQLLALCHALQQDLAASLAAIGSDVAQLPPFSTWQPGGSPVEPS